MSVPIMETISHAVNALADFSSKAMCQKLEAVRLARVNYALTIAGCSIKGAFPNHILASCIVSDQQTDGGWADVEETLWCLGCLSQFGHEYETELAKGKRWLNSVRLSCGAWGKSNRDQPRIPITALISEILPDVVDSTAPIWLSDQWESDLTGPTPLTYKGAFFLLSTSHKQIPHNSELIERTATFLVCEQNEDGGFGPWKGHPIGSCPWTTGVTLWGLSKAPSIVPSNTLRRAVSWLESKQLPNGLWPYHYLDDATAMVLIGLSSILPLLTKQS